MTKPEAKRLIPYAGKVDAPLELEPPPVPWNVRKLQALRPGERLVYYRGNFERVIDGRDRGDIASARGAYRHVLEQVRATAERLARDGRISIHLDRVRIKTAKGSAQITEHVAYGRRQ